MQNWIRLSSIVDGCWNKFLGWILKHVSTEGDDHIGLHNYELLSMQVGVMLWFDVLLKDIM